MSTRAVIARPAPTPDNPDAFVGVYHHFDGYPTGLGATLYYLYRGHFARDGHAMLRTLLDEHPAGWSTIYGDFAVKPGYIEHLGRATASKIKREADDLVYHHFGAIRDAFDGPHHKYSPDDPMTVGQEAQRSAMLFLYAHPRYRIANRPQCYCHGSRHEEAQSFTYDDVTADTDIEYVYVIDPERKTMRVSVPVPGALAEVATVDLESPDDDPPDWETLEQRATELANARYATA